MCSFIIRLATDASVAPAFWGGIGAAIGGLCTYLGQRYIVKENIKNQKMLLWRLFMEKLVLCCI